MSVRNNESEEVGCGHAQRRKQRRAAPIDFVWHRECPIMDTTHESGNISLTTSSDFLRQQRRVCSLVSPRIVVNRGTNVASIISHIYLWGGSTGISNNSNCFLFFCFLCDMAAVNFNPHLCTCAPYFRAGARPDGMGKETLQIFSILPRRIVTENSYRRRRSYLRNNCPNTPACFVDWAEGGYSGA